MFVLKKGQNYFWPVKIELPVDGGKFDKHTFDAEFKRLPHTEYVSRLKDENAKDADFVREVVVGWKGIKDESGNDLPFSEQALADLLEIHGVAKAISIAYIESFSGIKAKN